MRSIKLQINSLEKSLKRLAKEEFFDKGEFQADTVELIAKLKETKERLK